VIYAGELKKAMVIIHNGEMYIVADAVHYKPTKGGGLMRTKLRSISKDTLLDYTFSTSEKLETADMTWRRMQYLYADGDEHVFMDNENFEQYHINKEVIGESLKWLIPNMNIDIALSDNVPIMFNLPAHIVQEVIHTEPGIKGDTVSGSTKPAEIESGVTIQVPLFIKVKDKIRVDTRDASYIERVKE